MALTPRTDWDPRAWQHAAFAPLHGVLGLFDQDTEWPTIARMNSLLHERLEAALGDESPYFEEQIPKPKRRREKTPRGLADLYDGHIQTRRRIPTRACNWHDFFNACVWAWLPRTKQALSARQFAAAAERLPARFVSLPPTRSKEQDVLALLDEGGVLQFGPNRSMIFGHAIYEHLVSSTERVRGFGVAVTAREDAGALELDVQLAQALSDRAWPRSGQSPAVWISA